MSITETPDANELLETPSDLIEALDTISDLKELPEGKYTYNGKLESDIYAPANAEYEVEARKASIENGLTEENDPITRNSYESGETVLTFNRKDGDSVASTTLSAESFMFMWKPEAKN